MRIFTVAFGSFVLGVAVMFLLGNHTSTRLQAQAAPSGPTRQQIESICGVQPGNLWTPFIPPMARNLSEGNTIEGASVDLDGRFSRHEVFTNATIRYGGGNFEIRDVAFNGNRNFEFIGAARNTLIFMQAFGLLPSPRPQMPEVNPNAPTIKTASFTNPLKGTFVVK